MSEEMEFGLDLYTLEDEDGVETTFEKIDELEYEGKRYVALIPYYENEEDMLDDDGEFIVLMESEENGETYFVTVDSEEEYEKIGDIFMERIQTLFDYEDEEVAELDELDE